jgi:hypothetical protein
MDFVCVCIRIPKCGSTSLTSSLQSAFGSRRIFYLPHTLDIEGDISLLQRIRFCRSQMRNLVTHYRTTNVQAAYRTIASQALDGDLICGGHIDFPSVRENLGRPVKMITLFRNPITRCRSEYNYLRHSYFMKPALSRLDAGIRQRTAARFSFHGYLDFLLEYAHAYGDLAARYVGWDGIAPLDTFFAHYVFHSGLLEDRGGFAQGLSLKLGLPLHFPHDNESRISAANVGWPDRAKIERLYPRDFQLYEWQMRQGRGERKTNQAPTNFDVRSHGGEKDRQKRAVRARAQRSDRA